MSGGLVARHDQEDQLRAHFHVGEPHAVDLRVHEAGDEIIGPVRGAPAIGDEAVDVGGELDLDPKVVVSVGTSVIIRNGDPLGEWYGYQTDGIFQSVADILASGSTRINGQPQSTIRPGSRKFVDQNGDGIIDTQDRVVLGRGQPDFTGGLTNAFSYKGFNLNVIVQYSYGNKVYNANRVPPEASLNNDNLRAVYVDAWRPSLYDQTTGALVEQGNPNNKYRMPGNPEKIKRSSC